MRGAQLCKCAMTACTQLHTWQSRQELVTGAGGARGARRRRASGGGCRWMMPRWQRWPAWASSLRWCVRARSQRLVMHAFNCALLTMHARPLCICVRVAHLASMRRCAGRACHIFAACQHPRSFVVSPGRSAAAVHTVGAHTRPQTTPRCLQAVRALRFCAGDLPAAAAFAADERARARARRAQQRREAALRREQVMCAPGQHGCHGPCAACCGARSRCGQPEYPATKSSSCTHRCGLQRGRSTVSMHTLLAVLPARTQDDPQAFLTACKPGPRACLHALPRPARLTGRRAARRARSHHRTSEARRLQVRADGGGRARGHGRAGPAGLAGLRAAAGRRGPAAGTPRWRLSCHRHARAERAASPFVAPAWRGQRRACAGLPVGICGNHVQL